MSTTVPNLTEEAASAEMLARLATLTPDSERQWGKMTVVEMLAHCAAPLRAAFGEFPGKRGLIGLLFGRMAKKKMIDGDDPFGRNGPTDPKMLVPGASDFAEHHAALVALVERYRAAGPSTARPHPFFGKLDENDWNRLMWKHLDHHLRQFGV